MMTEQIRQWDGESKYVVAAKKWDRMLDTRYSDEEIKEVIQGADASNDEMVSLSYSNTALAMVAYNRMIEERVRSAQKSWGMKA